MKEPERDVQTAEGLAIQGHEALDRGEAREALALFSRAQKLDQYSFAAYMGMAEASARMATVEETNLIEVAMYFAEASTMAAPGAKESIRRQGAGRLRGLSTALWDECVERFRASAATDESLARLADQARDILWADDFVLRYDPKDEVLLRRMLGIAKGLLQGFPSTAPDGTPLVRRLGPKDEAEFREWKEKTTYRIRRLDPAYETPES